MLIQINVDVQALKARRAMLDQRVKDWQEWYDRMVEGRRSRIEKNDAWEEFIAATAKRGEFLELITLMGLREVVMHTEEGA